jgi:hypothetical protein
MPEAKAGLVSLRASCGRRGCWHAMHARTHRLRGARMGQHPVWPPKRGFTPSRMIMSTSAPWHGQPVGRD